MGTHQEDLTAIIAILVIFGMPIAFGMASRWYAHQERMAMIQRGMTPPIDPRTARRMNRMGVAPEQPGAAPPYYSMDYSEWQANRMLHKGIVVGMIGLALLIGLSFIDGIVGFHGPWLLGGLIPLFIGIAQVIIAVLSGARLGGMQPMPPPQMNQAQQQQQPGNFNPPPRDVTPGPYAWRPGSTAELERPPSPPRDPQA